ncbi:MAG: 1-(5-phosphoribosyl)-5-[(5-phosphoribosylamino)methylideneamino] imidazole-4-carboxamide isomerase [Bacteroidales bacterium]|jgi:phosphoribosylformimino-5-aminoimidazole carboxamide ribotide isomerase|nr:1-(5-phosphoribosyl)-5-[(5-phosphoribosylamino)methylideneamino] imidazole-4-carboxamide isomerase [Bacteroidales bacterium]MDD4383622.1 1-(5-phosphoribosyl)-5-[(5-phosphoribosylamino)methylideneamino] imidazole-4-carboxamide isomerase [Bacteroidales bacterium]MDY0197296.1 1-(5-phosphoribosyl)-5-[(5-phosphoribosylamino)methylideneamino] imidazole-4-carboxamide isomerase [Tenuifilaceae bacterium]
MKLIPAIDLIDSKCVRLFKGDYSAKTIYNENPVDQAKAFADAGIEKLHLVDLSGAKAGHPLHLKILEEIAHSTNLKVDFGGGIRNQRSLEDSLNCGAAQVNLGTILIHQPEIASLWIQQFGAEKLIASVDVLNRKVKVSGWQKETGIEIETAVQKLMEDGFIHFTITDIDRDGTLGEPAFDLYLEIIATFPNIKLNASGGVSAQEQLSILESIGCDGAIVGKAIYEGRIII